MNYKDKNEYIKLAVSQFRTGKSISDVKLFLSKKRLYEIDVYRIVSASKKELISIFGNQISTALIEDNIKELKSLNLDTELFIDLQEIENSKLRAKLKQKINQSLKSSHTLEQLFDGYKDYHILSKEEIEDQFNEYVKQIEKYRKEKSKYFRNGLILIVFGIASAIFWKGFSGIGLIIAGIVNIVKSYSD